MKTGGARIERKELIIAFSELLPDQVGSRK